MGLRPTIIASELCLQAMFQPIGYTLSGHPVYPIFGAEDDGDKGDKPDDNGNDNDGDEDEKSKIAAIEDPKERRIAELAKESKDRRLALRAEQKAREKLEADLQAIKDKDLTETERAKKAALESTAKLEAMQKQMESMQIENAFLKLGGKYDWHDPGAALKLLDRSGITLQDDGEVTGLTEAVKELAKNSKFLLKTDVKKDDGGKGTQGGQNSSTGGNFQGSQRNNSTAENRQNLLDKYPQIGR